MHLTRSICRVGVVVNQHPPTPVPFRCAAQSIAVIPADALVKLYIGNLQRSNICPKRLYDIIHALEPVRPGREGWEREREDRPPARMPALVA